jgi:Colicin D
MFSRHAKEFGITSNWSKAAATEFEGVLQKHVQELNPIQGTYRGTQKVLHYFDPKTELNVMTDMSGNLVGGWKLSNDQITYLLSTGAVK